MVTQKDQVSWQEYMEAKALALKCAKNIVENFSAFYGQITGTDIEDALKSNSELTHQLAIIRRWWNSRDTILRDERRGRSMSTQKHTPYDAEIDRLRNYTDHDSISMYKVRLAQAEGYRQGIADYVPLLEAVKAIESAMSLADSPSSELVAAINAIERLRPQLRAAIAVAERKGA